MRKIEPDTVSIRTLWQTGLKGKVNRYEVEYWYYEENEAGVRRDSGLLEFASFFDLLDWGNEVRREHYSGGRSW